MCVVRVSLWMHVDVRVASSTDWPPDAHECRAVFAARKIYSGWKKCNECRRRTGSTTYRRAAGPVLDPHGTQARQLSHQPSKSQWIS